MAYHNHPHLSQDLPLPRFSDQHQQSTQPPAHTDTNLSTILDSSSEPTSSKPESDPHRRHPLQTAPNWLNNVLFPAQYGDINNQNGSRHNNTSSDGATNSNNNGNHFLNLHTAASNSTDAATQTSNQWLSRPIIHRNKSEVVDDVMAGVALSQDSTDLNAAGNALHSKVDAVVQESSGGRGGDAGLVNWQNAGYKAEILAHPLYEQLLSSHVACLRIATPVDQLPRIDVQLAQSQNAVAKYSNLVHAGQTIVGDAKDLDQFMVC